MHTSPAARLYCVCVTRRPYTSPSEAGKTSNGQQGGRGHWRLAVASSKADLGLAALCLGLLRLRLLRLDLHDRLNGWTKRGEGERKKKSRRKGRP